MLFKNLSNLQQRLIVGGLGITLALFAIFTSHHNLLGALGFTTFIALAVAAAVLEYYQIAQTNGYQPLYKLGILCSILFFFAVFAQIQTSVHYMLPEMVVGLSLAIGFLYYFIKGEHPFGNLAVTFFAILYLTIPLACLVMVNYFYAFPYVNDGRWCLIYVVLVTKVTDMGAFFIGKKMGKRQLSPYISPKKTWEGAVGGSLCAILTSLLFFMIFSYFFVRPPFALSFSQSIWLALMISIVAQFGDLAESLLKRDAGIKDSGNHLPGLGGFLDIVDSLVFTSPLMYIFLNLQTAHHR